jgi:membrane protease YdiL (CAAX protease family)
MSSSTAPAATVKKAEPLAPWWHTVLVLAALAGLSAASRHENGLPNLHLPGIGARLSSYLTVIAAEWLLVFLIWLALRRRGLSIGSLVSGRWPSAAAFFRDLGLALGFFVVVALPLSYLASRFAPFAASTKTNISPETVLELLLWLVMSATAGFCEEFVFRGYLTEQFSAWSGSRPLAIVLQAVVFGLGHAYYSPGIMLVVALLGLFLGLLAHWRKSLRPGMLFHGLQDGLGGVVAFVSGMR